jgi:hypothetical protein
MIPDPSVPAQPRPRVDLGTLNIFLESIRSFNQHLIFEGSESGEPLFHYTDLGGLLGIVTNHDLWLTHSLYCNDDEEMHHGYRLAREVLDEERAKPGVTAERTVYLDHLARLLATPVAEGVYICCFCRADNLLSQWRSYGANGSGVSLCFEPQEFSSIAGPDMPHGLMRLWKVFYEPERQKKIVRSAIDFGFSREQLSVEERAREAADGIQFFIPTFKHQGFQEESEWRLIFTPAPGCAIHPQFRSARGMLIPYYALQDLRPGGPPGGLPPYRLPLRSVRVGPSAHKRLNLESVRMLLRRADYPQVNVDVSEISYRG